jgi:hypothetical protein
MSGRQIDDAEAAHAQSHATLSVNPLIIRAAVNHGIAHQPEKSRLDPFAFFEF